MFLGKFLKALDRLAHSLHIIGFSLMALQDSIDAQTAAVADLTQEVAKVVALPSAAPTQAQLDAIDANTKAVADASASLKTVAP